MEEEGGRTGVEGKAGHFSFGHADFETSVETDCTMEGDINHDLFDLSS